MPKLVSHSPEETRKLAHVFAGQLVKKHAGEPLVIALEGELGAGKTTFVQAFAQALGVAHLLKSPTFVLMKSYKLKVPSYKFLHHLDCYRLGDPQDLKPLDIEKILKHKGNIVLIEWAERVRSTLPKEHVKVIFEHIDENTRNITVAYR